MPSERERDEDKDSPVEDREPTAAEDTDADESESADDGRILTRAEPEEQEQSDSPRNRAERRALAKQQRRGQTPARDSAGGADAVDRPARRPPPRTVSGKSSADEVPPWARDGVAWLGRHRNTLLGGAAAVLLVVSGAVFWTMRTERVNGEAAALYTEAVEISNAQIRAADAPPDPPNAPPRRGPTYTDATARARAALEAFRRVPQRFANAPIAPVARLGEAGALYDLARYAEARRVYESLVGGSNLAGQEARAYEGLGYTLEALNDLPAALRRYEEMARLGDGVYRDVAQFHQARVLHRQNQTARAKDILHGLIERLQRSRPNEPLSGSASSSVLEQAKALLHEIDPEDPLGRRSELPSDPDAILRMLEQQTGRRLRRPPGGAGGAGGTEAPAGGP